MIIGLQIVALLFSLVMMYFALFAYKRGELNRIEVFSWLIIWVTTIFIVLFPEILRTFARTLAISSLFDMMVIGAFVLVMTIVARVYISLKRVEKTIENMIRNDALKNKKKK